MKKLVTKKSNGLDKHSAQDANSDIPTIKRQPVPLVSQLLERRLLLDAAAFSTAVESVADAEQNDTFNSAIQALSSADTNEAGLHGEYDIHLGNKSSSVSSDKTERTSDIYIIDSSVSDLQSLLEVISDDADIHILDSDSDGIEQIGTILSGY